MATVREIARQAGVSKTTVSMVLNNRDGVSESMRKRVQDAMQALRTLEEAEAAKEMVVSSSSNPPILFPTRQESEEQPHNLLVLHPANIRSSTVFHEIIRGIQAAASLYHVQLNLALNEPDLLGNKVESLYFSNPILKPSGVLLIGAKIIEPVVEQARKMGIPVVLVGRSTQMRGVNAVSRDEEQISFEATQYLVQLGHTRIAFLGGSQKYSYTFDRLNGYRRALDLYGLDYHEEYVIGGFDEQHAARFLINCPEVTATVIINELFASRVLPIVQKTGRDIPGSLSVVTYDDTELSRNFEPPLTSVSFPFFQEGFWSVRVLMEQVRQPVILNVKVVLQANLVKRESCRPLRPVLQEAASV
jgi:DNA-binding LacI/PurR family transcriptional regulator